MIYSMHFVLFFWIYVHQHALSQCLVAARDGFDAESSMESFKHLYTLETSLAGGVTPNATLVGQNDHGWTLSSILSFLIIIYDGCRMAIMPLPLLWVCIDLPSDEERRTSLRWPVCWAGMLTYPIAGQRYTYIPLTDEDWMGAYRSKLMQGEPDLLSQPWSVTMKALLEEAILVCLCTSGK